MDGITGSYSEMESEEFSNSAKSGYNKGTTRGDIWLLKTHRSQGAMRERGVCDRFAHAEIVIRVAQIVAQKRASLSR